MPSATSIVPDVMRAREAVVPAMDSRNARTALLAAADTCIAEAGWRNFLETMGIPAAIMAFTAKAPDSTRQAYLIGLDQARSDPQLTEALIAFAEGAWKSADDAAFHAFRVSTADFALDRLAAGASSGSVAATLLRQFDHAAVMQCSGSRGTLRALLFRARQDDGQDDGFDACQRSLLAAAPMFMDAAATHAASLVQRRHSELLEAMFDRVSLAVLLVDAGARPLFCNDAARAMLDGRDTLLQGCDGSLSCNGAAETKRLRTAIQSVANADADAEAVLRIGTSDGNWRMAFVVPARTRASGGMSRCSMVLVDTREACEAPGPLLRALGLLPSEQRFLNAFLRSNNIAEAAGQSGLSEETARTYLKRVRAKLGVHRQMELAQLIYGLVPPLRQPAPQPAEQG